MANVLKHAWWMLLVGGLISILFAVLLLTYPGMTLATGAISFTVLFALYALIEGGTTIAAAVTHRKGQWFLLLILGVIGVLAGLIALMNPLFFSAITVQLIIYVFAFKSIAGGIVGMISAWHLRREIDNEWLLGFNGLFSVLFGVILFFYPLLTLEVLITLTAFYLLIVGTLQIVLAFRMRVWQAQLEAAHSF